MGAHAIPSPIDYSHDRIGERLTIAETDIRGLADDLTYRLASDDLARVEWVVERAAHYFHNTPTDTKTIVDIGSSDGAVIARVLTRLSAPNAYCIESHPAHAATLPQTIRAHELAPRVWCSFDSYPCPLPSQPFGALLTEVLEHWPPVIARSNLQYLRTQLAPRSLVIITVPNANDASFGERRRSTWPDHKMLFHDWSLVALLEVCGFKVQRIEGIVTDGLESIWLGCIAQAVS